MGRLGKAFQKEWNVHGMKVQNAGVGGCCEMQLGKGPGALLSGLTNHGEGHAFYCICKGGRHGQV